MSHCLSILMDLNVMLHIVCKCYYASKETFIIMINPFNLVLYS